LCINVIQKEKPSLENETNEENMNSNHHPIKQESFDEKENNATNISNNILERVAEIRRNQKPIQKFIKQQVVLPKDLFSKSVRELELANLEFNKQNTKALHIETKPFKDSFKKRTSMENESNNISNKLSNKKSEFGNFSQFVPLEIMDDWDADNVLDNQKGNMKLQNLPDSFNVPALIDADVNFSTANGKGIAICEEYLKRGMKMYNEIEDEIQSTGNLLNIKKFNEKLNPSTQLINRLRNNKTLINCKDNLFRNGSPCNKNFFRLDNNFNNMTEKLSTVSSETIVSSKNKRLYDTIENKTFSKNNYHEVSRKKSISNISQHNFNSKVSIKIEIEEKKEPIDNSVCNQEIKDKVSNCCEKLTVGEFSEQNNTIENMEDLDNNGFTTAGGKGIQINEEKENYYLKIFHKLGEDIQNESCFLNIRKNDRPKGNCKIQPFDKASITFNKVQEKVIVESKLNHNNTKVICSNYDNLEQTNIFPKNSIELDNKNVNNKNQFTVPNSTHILKKLNSTTTINKNEQKNSLTTSQKEISFKGQNLYKIEGTCTFVNNNANSIKSLKELKLLENLKVCKSEQNDKYMTKLKQKLDHCEVKRPERCRSFGGFPISEESVASSKLNKSDPMEESFTNQPLKNGLSISQCFDSHSDSWLSKVEISHLNSSKMQSPILKIKTEEKPVNVTLSNNCIAEEYNEFMGFSFKECTENFRKYANFKRILSKLSVNNKIGQNVDSGRSISLHNQNSMQQQLLIQSECNKSVKKNTNESSNLSNVLIPKICNNKLNIKNESKVQEHYKTEKHEKVVEKRKHIDTDNDTPLSTMKKPRVGSELQGRKLFCDELNDDGNNFIKTMKNQKPLPCLNTSVVTNQEHEDLLEKRLQAIFHQVIFYIHYLNNAL
jgi:hypothetical protein